MRTIYAHGEAHYVHHVFIETCNLWYNILITELQVAFLFVNPELILYPHVGSYILKRKLQKKSCLDNDVT